MSYASIFGSTSRAGKNSKISLRGPLLIYALHLPFFICLS